MVQLAVAVLVLALASVALAQNTDCHGTVGGKYYDLSGLAKAVPNGLGSTVDGLGQSYEFKVCGNLGAQCQWTGDTTPAMCQKDTNNNQHDCGSQKKAYWAALADGSEGFILAFGGGEDNRKAVVNFKCDKNAKTGLLQFNQENPQHTYIFTWATEYACSGGGGGQNDYVCCLFAGSTSGCSEVRTLCQTETLHCPTGIGSYKLAYNWTVPSCDDCKFRS